MLASLSLMLPTLSAGSVIETVLLLKETNEAVGWIRDGYKKYKTTAGFGVRSAVDENDKSLGRLRSSIDALCQAIQDSQVQITPSQIQSVDLQSVDTDIREFVERCKADPSKQGIADECKELEVRLDRVFMRINVFINLAMERIMRQMDSESPARKVRQKLSHVGCLQVYTTEGSDEDGRDSIDSRACTPPRTEDVWVALYSVEHENERGTLLRQLRHNLEGSKMLTFASLIMFDFIESARVQDSNDLNWWRNEIRLSLSQQSALTPEEREKKMADKLNFFLETGEVEHHLLGCSVPPFFELLPEADKRGCAHVVFHLVRSQLKGLMLSTWEREDSWTPPPINRQEFFKQVNQFLQNKFAMRQLGWARNGSSSVLFIRASCIWAHLASLAIAYDPLISSRCALALLVQKYLLTGTKVQVLIPKEQAGCINWVSV